MTERQQIRRRFVQIAAHEIRNPMAGIKGMLDLVLERVAAGRPVPRPEVLLRMMAREVDLLAQLTDSVLEAFHTEDPDCRFDLAPQDLRPLCGVSKRWYRMRVACRRGRVARLPHRSRYIRKLPQSATFAGFHSGGANLKIRTCLR